MIIKIASKILAPAVLAGAAAAAVLFAPAAGASSADCNDNGAASVCTRDGHASIYANPNTDVGTFNIVPGAGNPFGAGSLPLLAID